MPLLKYLSEKLYLSLPRESHPGHSNLNAIAGTTNVNVSIAQEDRRNILSPLTMGFMSTALNWRINS